MAWEQTNDSPNAEGISILRCQYVADGGDDISRVTAVYFNYSSADGLKVVVQLTNGEDREYIQSYLERKTKSTLQLQGKQHLVIPWQKDTALIKTIISTVSEFVGFEDWQREAVYKHCHIALSSEKTHVDEKKDAKNVGKKTDGAGKAESSTSLAASIAVNGGPLTKKPSYENVVKAAGVQPKPPSSLIPGLLTPK